MRKYCCIIGVCEAAAGEDAAAGAAGAAGASNNGAVDGSRPACCGTVVMDDTRQKRLAGTSDAYSTGVSGALPHSDQAPG